jgi:hypothetical protein
MTPICGVSRFNWQFEEELARRRGGAKRVRNRNGWEEKRGLARRRRGARGVRE